MALAQAHQYTVHAGAKNLRSGENRTLGLGHSHTVLDLPMQLTDPFFLAMMGQLADAMTAAQYDLLLSRVDADHLDECAALFDSGRVAGMVMVGQWDHHDQLNALAKRRVPCGGLGRHVARSVVLQRRQRQLQWWLASHHPFDRTRSSAALPTLGDFNSGEAKFRFDGYCQALQKNNMALNVNAELCIQSPYTPLEAQASHACVL
jgi:DNA-binding LacI/PurR family transcriptional regulator